MNKLGEKLLYLFGVNISAYDVKHEIKLLKTHLPGSFKRRDVTDIGCGDGRVSLKIERAIKANTFKGIDISHPLLKSAKRRGVEAEELDAEKQHVSGDLGILWGVIHHFKNPVKTLKKIRNEFRSLIIRAPINEKRVCELGHKYNKRKLFAILSKSGIDIKKCIVIESKKTSSLIIFFSRPDSSSD